ncbi:trp operon leader peptide [Citrobacter sp. Cy234]|uniref:trp operon leader peptide n=2 Tax=Citrobacter TaxID=544 RepID=A0A4P6WUX3_9ENTR|nr:MULTISPECIES: trp operon leader peptide [Citrobacter]MDG5475101.1 trp operon leader peptide [Citrobacter freundii]EIS7449778.1 trp operon leader peptide [Citrobacter youngae]MBJ8399675.1 trp operon leader peptide [Citrobacter youngae]MBJ8740815.1 trp operon leader peptide [Citrobacter sp. FDAARGOS_156]MBJ8883449.1 trp operon leader peptide [Citrobacter sp. FDAARGOS_156]
MKATFILHGWWRTS